MCEKPIILVELLFELRIVVIQDSEDGKRTACKKCAWKIVNCYRMFAEFQEALACGRALDKRSRPRTVGMFCKLQVAYTRQGLLHKVVGAFRRVS